MPGFGVHLGKDCTNLCNNFTLKAFGGLRAGQKTLGFQPFGKHHLMPVKEQMHIRDLTASVAHDRPVIDQITRSDQHFSLAKQQLRKVVADQHAVQWRDQQITVLTKGIRADVDRRKFPFCLNGALANPANRLRTIVLGQHQITGVQLLCRDLARWHDDEVVPDGFTVSVNVSATELSYADFPDRVSRILRRLGTDPASLRIEITETAALSDRPRAIQVLTELRSLGVSVALDDFGTGYATFASLRSLPIDVVKIDQSFIRCLPDRASETVVHSVVDLAGVLGLRVVAEGVEQPEHLDFVRTAGVDLAQGYLFSHPVGPDEISRQLASS